MKAVSDIMAGKEMPFRIITEESDSVYIYDNTIKTRLIFVLPPYHHTIYEKVIKELDMEGEILRYQEVLASCAEVRNMKYVVKS